MPLIALVGFAFLFGLAVTAVVRRSPKKDPSAPRLASADIKTVVHRHPHLRAYLRRRFDPATTTGLVLTSVILILVVTTTLIGVLVVMVRSNYGAVRYDSDIAHWAMRHAASSPTGVMRFITQFGGAVFIIPLAVGVAVVESLRVRSRSVWTFLILVVGGQFLLANSIKFLVNRSRPALDQLTGFSGTSFPSGHATAAAATYAAFALLIGMRRSANIRAISAGLAVSFAIVIAGTRVLLGVHWLTDNVAGLVLGWAWFAICSLAFGGRFLHFGAPAEVAQEVVTPAVR
ncbi:MAG: phosphatase PAP2 family protein [Ilumatobacteraceae bacterium]